MRPRLHSPSSVTSRSNASSSARSTALPICTTVSWSMICVGLPSASGTSTHDAAFFENMGAPIAKETYGLPPGAPSTCAVALMASTRKCSSSAESTEVTQLRATTRTRKPFTSRRHTSLHFRRASRSSMPARNSMCCTSSSRSRFCCSCAVDCAMRIRAWRARYGFRCRMRHTASSHSSLRSSTHSVMPSSSSYASAFARVSTTCGRMGSSNPSSVPMCVTVTRSTVSGSSSPTSISSCSRFISASSRSCTCVAISCARICPESCRFSRCSSTARCAFVGGSSFRRSALLMMRRSLLKRSCRIMASVNSIRFSFSGSSLAGSTSGKCRWPSRFPFGFDDSPVAVVTWRAATNTPGHRRGSILFCFLLCAQQTTKERRTRCFPMKYRYCSF
eukprot:Rhum_TRINITY_DN4861_c0_g2::Rhum_TRINITY_DN4861_c0_g2_i1::g.15794::m.15794